MVKEDLPTVASREEWLAARQQLLAQEKELTRQACHPLGPNVGGPSMRLPDEYGQA